MTSTIVDIKCADLNTMIGARTVETSINAARKRRFKKIMASILTEGIHIPVLVNEDKVILDGNLRVAAAKELGMESVPCLIVPNMNMSSIRGINSNRINWSAEDWLNSSSAMGSVAHSAFLKVWQESGYALHDCCVAAGISMNAIKTEDFLFTEEMAKNTRNMLDYFDNFRCYRGEEIRAFSSFLRAVYWAIQMNPDKTRLKAAIDVAARTHLFDHIGDTAGMLIIISGRYNMGHSGKKRVDLSWAFKNRKSQQTLATEAFREKVVRDYEGGTPVKDLAEKYNRSLSSILKYTRESRANESRQREAFILRDYLAGATKTDLARNYGVSTYKVNEVLMGIEERNTNRNNAIRSDRSSGAPASDLSQKYGLSLSSIYAICKRR